MAGPEASAGPRRLDPDEAAYATTLTAPLGHSGHGIHADDVNAHASVKGMDRGLRHGDVVLPTITDCTNTST